MSQSRRQSADRRASMLSSITEENTVISSNGRYSYRTGSIISNLTIGESSNQTLPLSFFVQATALLKPLFRSKNQQFKKISFNKVRWYSTYRKKSYLSALSKLKGIFKFNITNSKFTAFSILISNNCKQSKLKLQKIKQRKVSHKIQILKKIDKLLIRKQMTAKQIGFDLISRKSKIMIGIGKLQKIKLLQICFLFKKVLKSSFQRLRNNPNNYSQCLRVTLRSFTKIINTKLNTLKWLGFFFLKSKQSSPEQMSDKVAMESSQQQYNLKQKKNRLQNLQKDNNFLLQRYNIQQQVWSSKIQTLKQSLVSQKSFLEKNKRKKIKQEEVQHNNKEEMIGGIKIYQNVYNNLLKLVYNSQQQMKKESLMQSLLMPLVQYKSKVNIIRQQNKSLQEILQQYRKHHLNFDDTKEFTSQNDRPIFEYQKNYQQMIEQNIYLNSMITVLLQRGEFQEYQSTQNKCCFPQIFKKINDIYNYDAYQS